VNPHRSRQIVLLDVPSNLGLRPPLEGSVPGCYKLGWALREAGLTEGLGAREAGVLVPPRYESEWQPGQGDRNADAIASYSTMVANRLPPHIGPGSFPVLLGGDCSVLIGVAMAMAQLGRFSLAFLDGHSDFRHPGNSSEVGSAAGEDLAIVTGRGDGRLVDLTGLGPYIRDEDVVAVGLRSDDLYTAELEGVGISTWSIERLRETGMELALDAIVNEVTSGEISGFWIHLDVDILDPAVMPAVDTPTAGGLVEEELGTLLVGLVAHRSAIGLDVTIFDPDLDPDGRYARNLVQLLRPVLATIR
jgi:arginase